MQVSAFGSDTQSDGGDVWTVDWDGKAKYWKQDAKVCFAHAHVHLAAYICAYMCMRALVCSCVSAHMQAMLLVGPGILLTTA